MSIAHAIEAAMDRAESAGDRAHQMAKEEADAMAGTSKPECPYCGATAGLRIACDGGAGSGIPVMPPDYICRSCFKGADDGPCFDDLPPVEDGEPGEILGVVTAENDPGFHAALTRFVMFGR